ncbi:hypothetical protein [Simkania negevensis]|uniref:Uncharacterized protein n=1 Tax=Simkania negevensis (strain ATCC VR-1471 / DSM 27360 / Z) TaxID=331113 RepID=F8L905_SIMNZ|nr:hypothetical protein [Simkania negevensis]CCB89313.1 hypothetical protein SNE_A14360 [Simkania negevensis Z]
MSQTISLMTRQVTLLDPYGVGALTSSATQALSIYAVKKVFKADSPELHVAATVMGLALSTIALPYIIGKWAIHSAIRLNFETAVRTAVTSLLVKTTIFTLYSIGKSFVDQYHWETPKKLKDLDNLGTSQLQHVKAFFMDHTDQKENLTLALQHALTIPLGKCSGIGDGWTKESLQVVQKQDLSFLTLEQKKELNELFLQNHLLPSKRDYVKGELPSFPESLTKLSLEQLTWTHLIAQLSDTAISPELAKQFYEQGFPPAKTEWIDWALPIQVDLLSKTDLSWVKNDLIAHPEKWRALDLETQRKLKEKITLPYLVFPQTKGDVNALTMGELKTYWDAFEINDNLKKEFPLEMRRVFADRFEEKLSTDIDYLFFDIDTLFFEGEERIEPYYLFGRVTPKQVLTVGLIVMVVAVPAIAALGSLYYGASTSTAEEPINQNKTQEIIPSPSEEVSLPKFDFCPDNNCLMIPSGSKVVDHPVASPNITVHDQSWIFDESTKKIDAFTLSFLAHQKQTDPRDVCPENNCLVLTSTPLPISQATRETGSLHMIEPFIFPFAKNATIPVITEEFSPSDTSLVPQLALTNRTLIEINRPSKVEANNRAVSIVREEVCSVDAHSLTIPKGSKVTDHPVKRRHVISVKDRSWEPSLESAQKIEAFSLSILAIKPCLENNSMTRISSPLIDPAYNAATDAPQPFATPPVYEPIVLPPPKKEIITASNKNDPFTILDMSYLYKGTCTTTEPILDEQPGFSIWTLLGAITTIVTFGFFDKERQEENLNEVSPKQRKLVVRKNKEPRNSVVFPLLYNPASPSAPLMHEGRQIEVVNERRARSELANLMQNAQATAIEIEMEGERIQIAFDPNDPEVLSQFYRMMKQSQNDVPALANEGPIGPSANMRAKIGIISGGMRCIAHLNLSHPPIAALIQGLAIQARRNQQSVASASKQFALDHQGSVMRTPHPLALEYDLSPLSASPDVPEILIPPSTPAISSLGSSDLPLHSTSLRLTQEVEKEARLQSLRPNVTTVFIPPQKEQSVQQMSALANQPHEIPKAEASSCSSLNRDVPASQFEGLEFFDPKKDWDALSNVKKVVFDLIDQKQHLRMYLTFPQRLGSMLKPRIDGKRQPSPNTQILMKILNKGEAVEYHLDAFQSATQVFIEEMVKLASKCETKVSTPEVSEKRKEKEKEKMDPLDELFDFNFDSPKSEEQMRSEAEQNKQNRTQFYEAQKTKWWTHSYYVGDNGHPSKTRKYRVALEEYSRILNESCDVNYFCNHARWLAQKNPHNTLYQAIYRALQAVTSSIDLNPQSAFGSYNDARTQRQVLINSLRAAIVHTDYQEFRLKPEEEMNAYDFRENLFCRRVIRQLSEIIFLPEIHSHLKEVTDLFVGTSRHHRSQSEDLEPVTAENFVRKIHERNEDIKHAPKDILGKSTAALQGQKGSGALGTEDFIGTKNVPHLRNSYVYRHRETGKVQTVDYFRHGCPVTPGSYWKILGGMLGRSLSYWSGYDVAPRSGEAVAPEYEEMLYAKAARGEGDLYVNHQRRIPGGVENERDRVEVIEGLQTRHDNEFVLTQSVEGTLFKRQDPYSNITRFEDLIDAFVETFNQQDDVWKGVYAQNMLPKVFWDNAGLRAEYLTELRGLLQRIHREFFDGKEEIDFKGFSPTKPREPYPLREWQVFIELAYTFMRKDLIFRLSEIETKSGRYQVTSMKDICKDKLDRGGNEAKNEDETSYYMIGNPQDEWFEDTLYQLLGPPILVKKKEAITSRLEPGLALSQFLKNMSEEQKLAMRNMDFLGWKIEEVKVLKRSDQSAFPTKKTAHTNQEKEDLRWTEFYRKGF